MKCEYCTKEAASDMVICEACFHEYEIGLAHADRAWFAKRLPWKFWAMTLSGVSLFIAAWYYLVTWYLGWTDKHLSFLDRINFGDWVYQVLNRLKGGSR